jgi:hypothetical protein
MAEDREKISTGPNEEPINETIAGTGPGISDDSLAPGEEELPEAPSDEEVEEMAEKLGSPTAEKTLFRWKVNESRLFEALDSVIVQFRPLVSTP